MPPVRRTRGVHRSSAPYSRGWLSLRGRGRRDVRGEDDLDNSSGTSLPDDALSAVFTRFSDAADVVRCASTCRRWGRVVAEAATVLSHAALPPLPRLALGFFYQEGADLTVRKRCSAASPPQPCFVPTASGTRFLGFLHGPSFSAISEAFRSVVDGFFDHSRPVAARNGRLVLELRRERRADGVRLCVCNPVTGDVALLPPLTGDAMPGFYACALLSGDDLDPPRPSRTFFRVLIVYNRKRFTALRSYSPDTGGWSREIKRSGPKIQATKLRMLGQGVVLRGVAYWPLLRTVMAVRLDTPEPTEVRMPVGDLYLSDLENFQLLGVTPDGKLTFIMAGVSMVGLVLSVRVLETVGDDMCSGKWERKDFIELTQFKIGSFPTVHLRWFCERSGVLLFTLGERTNNPGTFALNLETREIEKVVGGERCEQWKNFVGYEMDGAAYLASLH